MRIRRGVAGFVLNGAILDADQFIAMNLPVFAAGTTQRGPSKDGPGEINVPIAIDGMVIHPGDMVLSDSNGVLAVPFEVHEKTVAKQDAEIRQMAAIGTGTNDRS